MTNQNIQQKLDSNSVHIWQKHAVRIGSFNDHGDEEEAYAIQSISQELMTSFIEQTLGDKE